MKIGFFGYFNLFEIVRPERLLLKTTSFVCLQIICKNYTGRKTGAVTRLTRTLPTEKHKSVFKSFLILTDSQSATVYFGEIY